MLETSADGSGPAEPDHLDWSNVELSADDVLHSPAFPSLVAHTAGNALLGDAARQRRTKALACLTPIIKLDSSKAMRTSDAAEYDLREIALAMIETVANGMAFGGITLPTLLAELRPLLERQQWGRTDEQYDAVSLIVFDVLREEINDAYGDYAPRSGDYVRRSYKRRLLNEVPGDNDELVLRASNEAINLIVSGLDVDLEDAQMAVEALLEQLVAKGKIDQALLAARDAHLRSLQYEQDIRQIISDTRRDIGTVDWDGSALETVDGAITHLAERLQVERRIIRTLEQQQLDALDAGADPYPLVVLRDTLTVCTQRHTRLHHDVLGAYEVFLEENQRQRFQPPNSLLRVALYHDILRPGLALGRDDALSLGDAFIRMTSTKSLRLPRLATLVPSLLQPPLDRRAAGVELDEPLFLDEPEDDGVAPEIIKLIETLLAPDRLPARLGSLLAEARSHSEEAAHMLALTVLDMYGPDVDEAERDRKPFLLSHAIGEMLDDPCFTGPDFLVCEMAWTTTEEQ